MAIKNASTLQSRFLNSIGDLLPPHVNLVNALTDLLDISSDSAYRRIRGETSLSMDEVEILTREFHLSFDSFCNTNSGSVTFHYKVLSGLDSFGEYLDDIVSHVELLSKSPNARIIYSAVDIPLFHHFRYPELAAFKMFYWMRSILQFPELMDKKFDLSLVQDALKEKGKKLYDLYCQVPSVEIWTEGTVLSNIKQIQFYWESGIFASKEDALSVVDEFCEELEYIQQQTSLASKKLIDQIVLSPYENNFQLYISDIELGNNCIYVTTGEHQSVYFTLQTFNKMMTSNQKFAEENLVWLNNLIRKSTLISGVGEKQRYLFFRNVMEKASALKKEIEG